MSGLSCATGCCEAALRGEVERTGELLSNHASIFTDAESSLYTNTDFVGLLYTIADVLSQKEKEQR